MSHEHKSCEGKRIISLPDEFASSLTHTYPINLLSHANRGLQLMLYLSERVRFAHRQPDGVAMSESTFS